LSDTFRSQMQNLRQKNRILEKFMGQKNRNAERFVGNFWPSVEVLSGKFAVPVGKKITNFLPHLKIVLTDDAAAKPVHCAVHVRC